MVKLSIAVSACACLILFCSPLLAKAAELGPSSPPQGRAEALAKATDEPGDLVNLDEMAASIIALVEKIKIAWTAHLRGLKSKLTSDPDQLLELKGNFLVVALNVVRKLTERWEKKHPEGVLKLEDPDKFSWAKAFSDGAKNVGNYFNELKDDARREVFVDPNDPDSGINDWLLTAANIAPESAGAKTDEAEANDKSLIAPATIEVDHESIDKPNYAKRLPKVDHVRGKTFEEYCVYVEHYNKELEDKTIESIKKEAIEFVKSLLLDQVKRLALILLQEHLNKGADTNFEVKAQLIRQIKSKVVKFVCHLFFSAITLIVERLSPDDHPDAPRHFLHFAQLDDMVQKAKQLVHGEDK